MNDENQKYLMASDAGYGFICTFSDTVAKNKAGKVLITLPDNAKVMTPIEVNDEENDLLLAVSQEGRMLLFPVGDLPQLSKGKGNKIISITSAAAVACEDGLAHLFVIRPMPV